MLLPGQDCCLHSGGTLGLLLLCKVAWRQAGEAGCICRVPKALGLSRNSSHRVLQWATWPAGLLLPGKAAAAPVRCHVGVGPGWWCWASSCGAAWMAFPSQCMPPFRLLRVHCRGSTDTATQQHVHQHLLLLRWGIVAPAGRWRARWLTRRKIQACAASAATWEEHPCSAHLAVWMHHSPGGPIHSAFIFRQP